jgi:hypothetical protein
VSINRQTQCLITSRPSGGPWTMPSRVTWERGRKGDREGAGVTLTRLESCRQMRTSGG